MTKNNNTETTDGNASTVDIDALNANDTTSTNNASDQELTLTETEARIIEMLRNQNLSEVITSTSATNGEKTGTDSAAKKHAFWDTQPMFFNEVPNDDTPPELHSPIIPNKDPSSLRQISYNMPKGFVWSDLNMHNENDKQDLYELLVNNYVEDDDCMFRFDYSIDFLLWALTPPDYNPTFHLGVRSTKSNRLMAFISAVPATIQAYTKALPMVEINFLCIHKKLRSKRLAPVLIKEITRRVNHTGVFQAVYTAGVVLPTPISSCRYYHRSLDPKKLVDIRFSSVPPRMTLARMQKLLRLPNECTVNLIPMEECHCVSAHQLLLQHLNKFQLHVVFTLEDFKHWLLPRKGVISSFVCVQSNDDGSGTEEHKVTDLISFYHLPSTIIGHPKHTHLNAAYSFYNIATSIDITTLMKDALILAKREGMDVFNALDQMENSTFLDELKFGKGDGNLQYYLYNWCCPTMESKDVGIVLL